MERQHAAAPSVRTGGAVRSNRFLMLVVLLAGIGTLGVEMVASRLLAPYFGTSQPIWAVVIGLTLIYLAIGYRLGGSLADRRPDARVLYRLIAFAGLATAFIPILSDPILRFSQQALASIAVGSFIGALLGVLLLFSVPVVLMAMVTPFALRLAIESVDSKAIATTSGTLSAISTIGSIIGTFLTVLYMIPAFGTATTTYIFAVFLVVLGLVGLRDWRYLLMLVAVLALAYYTTVSRANIKAADCRGCTLIHEEESAYNYIQVATRDTVNGPTTNLILNEGQAIHSIYNQRFGTSNDPLDLLTGGGPWDYFNVAPFVYPTREQDSVRSMAMLGSATGTMPAQFLAVFGNDATVDSVEIDPRIVALGREYFNMRDNSVPGSPFPNYTVHEDDARYWLETTNGQYDIIGMDAYHQPYIPFHLTTVEFFRSVRSKLTPQGVAVVNAGKAPSGDDRIGQALSATMLQVFPQVFVIETASFGNQILIGVNQPVGDGVKNFEDNIYRVKSPMLQLMMGWSLSLGEKPMREVTRDQVAYTPFTDDKAPVEQLIDSIIFDEAIQ